MLADTEIMLLQIANVNDQWAAYIKANKWRSLGKNGLWVRYITHKELLACCCSMAAQQHHQPLDHKGATDMALVKEKYLAVTHSALYEIFGKTNNYSVEFCDNLLEF